MSVLALYCWKLPYSVSHRGRASFFTYAVYNNWQSLWWLPFISMELFCCYCSYFRYCITQILDKLLKGEFKRGSERSLGTEKKKGKKKPKSAEYKWTVDEQLQEKRDTAKEYLVANNRNWGKMSAMMLAAQTQDRQIIAHDLCWRIICKIWRNGEIEACIFTPWRIFIYYEYRTKVHNKIKENKN